MTGAEWWESVRMAASEIGRAEARLAAIREPGPSGAHGGPAGRVTDPTGRMAMAIVASEAELAAARGARI